VDDTTTITTTTTTTTTTTNPLIQVQNLAPMPNFNLLWLKLVGSMAKDMRDGKGILFESTKEALRNIMLVMTHDGVFERLHKKKGQDVLELSWALIDSMCPTVRADVEPSVMPPPPAVENRPAAVGAAGGAASGASGGEAAVAVDGRREEKDAAAEQEALRQSGGAV
jgi:hypothetical protein